jgi:hypothetical protein
VAHLQEGRVDQVWFIRWSLCHLLVAHTATVIKLQINSLAKEELGKPWTSMHSPSQKGRAQQTVSAAALCIDLHLSTLFFLYGAKFEKFSRRVCGKGGTVPARTWPGGCIGHWESVGLNSRDLKGNLVGSLSWNEPRELHHHGLSHIQWRAKLSVWLSHFHLKIHTMSISE